MGLCAVYFNISIVDEKTQTCLWLMYFFISNLHCTHLAAFNIMQFSKAKRHTVESRRFLDATLVLDVLALNI